MASYRGAGEASVNIQLRFCRPGARGKCLTRPWPARIPKLELGIGFTRLPTHVCACVYFTRGVSITFIKDNKHLLKLSMSQGLF